MEALYCPKWSHLIKQTSQKAHENYRSRMTLLTKYISFREVIKRLGIILLYAEVCNNKHFISQSERAMTRLDVSITVIKTNEGTNYRKEGQWGFLTSFNNLNSPPMFPFILTCTEVSIYFPLMS